MPAIIRVVDGRTIIKTGENSALAVKYGKLAEQFANEAELSAETAALAAAAVGVYTTVGDGEAATTNGQAFYVAAGGEVTLYLNEAGVGVPKAALLVPSVLASTAPGEGASLVGSTKSPTVQAAIDVLLGGRDPTNAATAADLPDSTVVPLGGLQYKVDSGATGSASATNDLGVDGLIPFGTPCPAHFGAVGDAELDGDTIISLGTDDTYAIQRAIDTLPQGGTLDGLGLTYRVKGVFLKSRMNMINFNFIADGNGITDLSVINIGNDLSTANGYHNSPAGLAAYYTSATLPGMYNILLDNIHIFGNRSNQTNVDGYSEPTAARDGGKQGFALKRFCRNIEIRNSSAKYCGTDGIQIYKGLGAPTVAEDNPAFHNIKLINNDFSWNRRHGGSGDSIDGLFCSGNKWNDNGQTINGGSTVGDIGARLGATGNHYGNGFDMEGYGIGSRITNIRFINDEALRNVRSGWLFFDTVDQDDPTFLPRENIWMIDCESDSGTYHINGEISLFFTSSTGNAAKAPAYKNIHLVGGSYAGRIDLRSVDGWFVNAINQEVRSTSPVTGSPTGPLRMNLDHAINGAWRSSTSNKTTFSGINFTYTRDDGVLYLEDVWDPGTIAAGGVAKKTFTDTGINYDRGWTLSPSFSRMTTSARNNAILYATAIYPNGTVEVCFRNPTASPITFDSGTLWVRAVPNGMV